MKTLQDFFTDNHMDEVLHSLNTIPWHFDFQQNVITSNLSYIDTRYTNGISLHQLSFEQFTEAVLPEFREEMLEIYSRVKNGLMTHASMEMKMRIGESQLPVWMEVNIVAKEKDERGLVAKAVGSATIIQERKEAEIVMLRAQRKAEQANMIKTNFLSNMTHEFRTPLNAILGFSTIMAHSTTIEERMQCLGAIQTSGSQLIQMIEDVIELSKLEANEVELRRNLIDLNMLLAKSVEEAKPMRKPGVTMNYHNTEVPIILHGDEALDNACKFTGQGSIDVYCYKSSESAVVTIQDTGAGMSSENIHHIFDRFYKGNTFVPGTGLGMSVVRGLVELWNGTIKVDSNLNKGTSVTFTIPLHASFFQNRTQQEVKHHF